MKYASGFIPVAERIQPLVHGNGKDAKFFQKYGKNQLPESIWKEGIKQGYNTHQGIYLITPDGKNLGANWGPHSLRETRSLLKKGWTRWRKIVRKRQLKMKSFIPLSKRDHTYSFDKNQVKSPTSGRLNGNAALVLQVFSRDLPVSKSGRRWGNENWFELSREEVKSLVPDGKKSQRVPESLVRNLGRNVFVDNVKGLALPWDAKHVKKAKLVATPVKKEKKDNSENQKQVKQKITYEGSYLAEAPNGTMDLDIYGEGVWNKEEEQFEQIGIVALGIRSGTRQLKKGSANARETKEPTAIGFTITIERQK